MKKYTPIWLMVSMCSILLVSEGCSWFQAAKGPACQAIDTAHEACLLLKYKDENGNTQEVKVPSSEVAAGVAERTGKPLPLGYSPKACP